MQERVIVKQAMGAIGVRAIEVVLYFILKFAIFGKGVINIFFVSE